MPTAVPLSSEHEQTWLSRLTDDSGYGVYRADGQTWLMLQPIVFYNQRKRLMNGRLAMGRMEASTEHTLLPLYSPEIENLGVSRVHGVLLPLENGIAIEDVGSTNGTRLNGLPLISHRSYYLNHQDVVELGHLVLHVHFVAMEVFLKAVRDVVVKRFAAEVQGELQGVVAPTEALIVLLNRLPGMPDEQLQVLTAFKNVNEPLTLDKLHERINKVLGADARLPTPPSGEMVWEVPASRRTSEQPKTAVLTEPSPLDTAQEGKETVKVTTTSPHGRSMPYQMLLKEVLSEGTKIEAQFQGFLTQAQQLADPAERQMAVNLLKLMVTQLGAWLPMVKQDIPEA